MIINPQDEATVGTYVVTVHAMFDVNDPITSLDFTLEIQTGVSQTCTASSYADVTLTPNSCDGMTEFVALGDHHVIYTKDCFDRDSNYDACWSTIMTLDNDPSETSAIVLDVNTFELVIEAYDFNTVG